MFFWSINRSRKLCKLLLFLSVLLQFIDTKSLIYGKTAINLQKFKNKIVALETISKRELKSN
ncbi:MAG: hypothetical protein C0430_07535 [Flavobacterium sp.]|nr:hypothetical protein [Flavobacterium sp.]